MNVNYFIKKLVILVFSLFLIATLTFFLMKAIPGDPFLQEQAVPEEILQSMYAHYGLDQPWYIQYFKYIKGLAIWDFGPSFKYEGRQVVDIIKEGFPVSLFLGFEALVIAVLFGISFGTIAAMYHLKWQDNAFMIIAVLGISIPNFLIATFLQHFIAMKLNLLPVARFGSFAHTILPAISLAALPMAFIARLTRSNMIDTLQQDYIETAIAKGLSRFQIVMKHALKNSLLPVVTYLGPLASAILTGSFVVEKIFGIPGLGGWFVLSITNRDYTVIMGVTVFYSALLLLSVFIIDILYPIIDPRIQFLPSRRNR